MKKKVIAVSDVNRYVNRLLEEDYLLSDLWISGEVSNCKYHHSGHIYFTIKDREASINSVMFARDASQLGFKLEEGLKIYARCRIALYQKTGAYQAYVREVEKEGKGDLYEKFERLKQKLEKEGLFDAMYKKALPRFPKKVGVVTSHTGAAIKDIINVANRRNKNISIYIYSAHVQGEYAKNEIVRCIEKANEDQIVDVLIVGRGGGSIEDLWTFNEEEVARAIHNSKIPIVSAVGHEVDFTIADFVSDIRAATPSAAAEIVFPSSEQYQELIEKYTETLKYRMNDKINYSKEKLDYLLARPVYANKRRYFEEKMQQVDSLTMALEKSYKNNVNLKRAMFENKVGQLEKLSPLSTLKRGYSVVSDEQDQVITSVKEVEENQLIKIIVSDGSFKAKIEERGVQHAEKKEERL